MVLFSSMIEIEKPHSIPWRKEISSPWKMSNVYWLDIYKNTYPIFFKMIYWKNRRPMAMQMERWWRIHQSMSFVQSKIHRCRIFENISNRNFVFNVIVEPFGILSNVNTCDCLPVDWFVLFLAHLFPFVNQCWNEKTGHLTEQDDQRQQNEELLLGVTSYFK